jgi:high affinity cGMP-specific 3',5'-cyclic phosphodiesterase 9
VTKAKVAEVKVVTRKTVHVSYEGKTEALLVTSKMGVEDVTEILLTVANLDTDKSEYYSVLLSEKNGGVVSLAAMPENSAETSYVLKVTDLNPETLEKAEQAVKEQENNMDALLEKVSMLKTRIKELEDTDAEDARIPVVVAKVAAPPQVIVVHEQVIVKEEKKTRHFQEENQYVFTEETLRFLKTPNFDNWQWEDNEIMGLLELIFKVPLSN